jgi:hypothetical protein
MSTSLKRARKPFLTRNLLTGGVIAAFAAGTFWYSIAAVQQDDFVSIVFLPAVLQCSHFFNHTGGRPGSLATSI